jgi:Ni/Co efflux regulator RcnB
MRKIRIGSGMAVLLTAAMLAPMAMPASAAAQDAGWQGRQDGRGEYGRSDDGRGPRDGNGRPGGYRDQGQAQAPAQGQPQASYGRANDRGGPDGARGPQGPGGPYGDPRGGFQGNGGQGGRYDRGRPDGYGAGGYRGGGYGGAYGGGAGYRDPRGGGWSRDWRQDRRYDWNGYRQQNRRAFGLPRYAAPGGWRGGYRRFGIGVSLSAPLFGRPYWIQDPWAYRLPPAYGPLRWVRYYDDALLIDLRSGVVVDGVYGIFY